jgi:uncharacterized protein
MVENEEVKGIDSKEKEIGKKETKGIGGPKVKSKDTKKSKGKVAKISLTSDDKSFAVISHLSGLLMYVLPFFYVIVPLLIWLIKSEESTYVRHHARQSTFFQFFVMLSSLLLTITIVGILLLPVVIVFHIVCTVLAALAASRGELYSYPVMGWVLDMLNIEA